MKIVKRDGRTVDYNSDKIRIAIGKANDVVSVHDRISDKEIDEIIEYIESLDKKRMLVEDIQDIIEEKLMEKGYFSLAKKYIIYRYKRSIIRQSNTTDASILTLLKNGNNGLGTYLVANRQRDVMAGEASKDLAYRLLLPKNVVEADKKNRIKFCKVEHFTEPIIESSKIDLAGMLDRGTVINGVMIETPKSFQSACNVLVEIVGSISYCQTGAIYIELKDLFKYYNMTYEKRYARYKVLMKNTLNNDSIRALSTTQSFIEVKSGIQTIFYQINTLTLPDGRVPEVYFLIDLKDITSEYEEMITYEFVKQMTSGIKNEEGKLFIPEYPSIFISLDTGNPYNPYEYISHDLLSSGAKFLVANSKTYAKFNEGLNRFNQGSIIINLGHIALESDSFDDFLDRVDENLDYCYEGMLCRNHNLQGVYSDKSPLHFRFGAITRLDSMERVDQFLKKEHSYMNLVVIGFEAASKILGFSDDDKKMVRDKIMSYIKKWNKESTFDVQLSNYYDDSIVDKLCEADSSELKKFSVKNYCDSLEFIRDNYFTSGNIYYETSTELDLYDSELVSRDIIIKKVN